MVVPVTNILEKDFDPQNTKDLNLSLLIGPDRLSYLVIEPDAHKVLAISVYSFEGNKPSFDLIKSLEELIKSDPLLTKEYTQVNISLYTRRFTIIPNELFDEKEVDLYFNTAMHVDSSDLLKLSQVDALTSTLIYSVSKSLDELLTGYFPGAIRNCSAGPIIRNALKLPNPEEFIVLALLQARSICLTVIHKGQLLLHQIYGFQKADDCLYYVLLAYKKLGLSTEKHPILLAGELIQDSEIYKLLYQYIRNISFVNRPEELNYGPDTLRLPKQFYYDLFSIAVAQHS